MKREKKKKHFTLISVMKEEEIWKEEEITAEVAERKQKLRTQSREAGWMKNKKKK